MIGNVLAILYAVAQLLVPSLPPAPLSSTALLNNDKYLGKWYFVGVGSWDTEDIQGYQGIDNSMAELKKTADGSLVMTATMLKDACATMSWTYQIDPTLDPIMTEGDNFGMAFDGKWVDCDSCMLLLKIHPDDAFLRIMLFARNQDQRAELVERFKTKMESYGIIDQFVIPPQTKDFCPLE